MKAILPVVFLVVFLSGCASSGGGSWSMPVDASGSQADADAYAADAMIIPKNMPHRPDPKPWEFYYKSCSINGSEEFYSRTSYDCTGPSY